MYERLPSAEKLAQWGLRPEDFAGPPVEVWPENYRAFLLFCDVQTQWRAGAMGPIGLDYNVLFRKMDRMKLDNEEYDQLESDIRTMELEALAVLAEAD